MRRIYHEFPPVYNEASRVLILGSFPSVKSRQQQFYYGHPQNRFWKVLAAVCETRVPDTVDEKKAFLLSNGIAVYDVVESCTITGSSDSSIRNVKVTDLSDILQTGQIGSRIFTNGGKAYELYEKYTAPLTGIDAVKLPSTSPANAAYSLEKLIDIWSKALVF